MNISKEEYKEWIKKVKKNGWDLRLAPQHIRNDKTIALAAVQESGDSLEYASTQLRNDKDVVIAAIKQFGYALRYASPELQNDKEVALTAVQKNDNALQFVSPELRNDKDVVLAAVKKHGGALEYASPELQNDKEVVMTAIHENGDALEFSTPELQNDIDVVLVSVKQNPDNIKYANEELKRDREILIAAGMYDEDHDEDTIIKRQQIATDDNVKKKIVLSTRFSLDSSSFSQATKFTKLLKENEYIRNNFLVYAPNAFDKKTCDPNWTDFDWPCRGTRDTCQMDDDSLKTGHPTDRCCWRYSYRYHLEDANESGGFMLQLVESGESSLGYKPQTLGKGQEIERDMAQSMGMKVFHVHRPILRNKVGGSEGYFYKRHVDHVVAAIKHWYDKGCEDMSECVVHRYAPVSTRTLPDLKCPQAHHLYEYGSGDEGLANVTCDLCRHVVTGSFYGCRSCNIDVCLRCLKKTSQTDLNRLSPNATHGLSQA